MGTRINGVLVRTLGVASSMLTPVGVAVSDSTPMNGGMMEHGNWYSSGGVWLPALVIIVLGVVMYAVLRKKN